ncbi:hypothetical protein [Amycolatopsis sp. NBC_00438]|uniref:hypothetical protein n=1 Tax=Amycolatopsis sp. NBC_00438 TaxID=2903558 RepID=UPI002E229FDC
MSTMRDHVTKAIYDCTLGTFDDIKARHTHPLGEISKEEIRHIDLASNWEPDFAFVHLFHLMLEAKGQPPLWSEFDQFVETDRRLEMFRADRAALQDRIFREELEKIKTRFPKAADPENKAQFLAKASLDWRIGNAYYGFMREMYTAVALREKGLNVKVHPLADANFRADGWLGRNILSVFVINPRFKVADQKRAEQRQKGRKKAVEDLFPGNQFGFAELTMEGAERFGEFHFPSQAAIDEVERSLRRMLNGSS